MPFTFAKTIASFGLLALLPLTGCGDEPARGAKASALPSRQASASASPAFQMRSDYDPAASPSDLADDSSLVIRGHIIGHSRRATLRFRDDPSTALTATVMDVRIDEVLSGTPSAETPGIVRVQFIDLSTTARIAQGVPAGSETVLYLRPALPLTTTWPGVLVEPDAAFGGGDAPLYDSTNPQGFMVVDEASGTIALPEKGTVLPATSSDEVEPQRTESFPEDRPASEQPLTGGA